MEVGDSGACGIGLPEGIRVGGGRPTTTQSAGDRGGHLAQRPIGRAEERTLAPEVFRWARAGLAPEASPRRRRGFAGRSRTGEMSIGSFSATRA